MQSFSKRNKIVPNELNLESISVHFNLRILNMFIIYAKKHTMHLSINDSYISYIEEVMTELGYYYEIPKSEFDNDKNAISLRSFLTISDKLKWYDVYDFIEKSLYVAKSKELEKIYNRIMEEEGSLYRIVNGLVVPIINDEEIESIQNASSTKYESVNNHIEKALELLQKRQNPDYENSIKESISAVESLCSIITGNDSKNNTLGNTLDLIEGKGIHIHTALKEAFKKIYGYASDEKGIRHAGAIENGAKREDAIYMLVSCSAFVNYLIAKYEDKKN